MSNVLITGSSGFLGCALYQKLISGNSYRAFRLIRLDSTEGISHSDVLPVEGFNEDTIFPLKENEFDIVIHLAGIAHNDGSSFKDDEYYRVNTRATLEFARQAAASGVKRFIFISSIGVLGQVSSVSLNEDSEVRPYNAYTDSKAQAEQGLCDISRETGMEVVIIRPPLIFGPGAPGNFGKLYRLADSSLPLPFGLIHNQRSMIYIENLVAFILLCMNNQKAANEIFVISDPVISLSTLVSEIRGRLGRSSLLVPVPKFIFSFLGFVTGKKRFINQLIGDLVVDTSKAEKLLNWSAPYSVEDGIDRTVKINRGSV